MINEKELITQLQDGDITSLELLYREYGDRLYSYALVLTGRRELAEDVVTDTFVQIYERVKNNMHVKSLRILAYRTCREMAYQAMKYRGSDCDMSTIHVPHSAMLPHECMEMRAALEKLPSPEKEIMLLSCVHDLGRKEIAESLELSLLTVSKKYHSAVRLMKKSLIPAL